MFFSAFFFQNENNNNNNNNGIFVTIFIFNEKPNYKKQIDFFHQIQIFIFI